jgi:cell division protein ZipA
MQRHFSDDVSATEAPTEEPFEVIPITKSAPLAATVSVAMNAEKEVSPVISQPMPTVMRDVDDEHALSSRMEHLDSPTVSAHVAMEREPAIDALQAQPQAVQSQLFALLVLSPPRELSRKQIHAAMEASRLYFYDDGTYVHRDTAGNVIFRVANVIEPGFFPVLDDETFSTPGIALVLELPSTITPYRAMDEFITVARKVSQNLGGKLYDAQRHLIKESDLKAMREYAQSLTH